ncbi:MAG: NUDIX pyrophosphatase, partial [Euryarchaeota archaeon]|nr:NUDIX pyrophosphatase [Euryarchaeota archaeon]
KRELFEETALVGVNWLQLDSTCTLPKTIFNDHMYWPKHLHVVPEYAFSVEVQGDPLLSSEHSEYRWCDAIQAQKLLKYDSNRIALWELCERLKDQGKRIPELDRF